MMIRQGLPQLVAAAIGVDMHPCSFLLHRLDRRRRRPKRVLVGRQLDNRLRIQTQLTGGFFDRFPRLIGHKVTDKLIGKLLNRHAEKLSNKHQLRNAIYHHAVAVYTLATPKVNGCASALVNPAVSISAHISLPLGNCSMVPARYS